MLTESVLGPHYRYFRHHGSWLGFVYCEHFHGKNFKDAENNKRHGYPGAVARVQNKEILVLLDQSMDPEHLYRDTACDLEQISISQPNFLERFATIKSNHHRVLKKFNLRQMRTRGNSHMIPRPSRV